IPCASGSRFAPSGRGCGSGRGRRGCAAGLWRAPRAAWHLVRGGPAPHFAALAAVRDAVAVDVGDDLAVAAEQRLRRAHLGARRQLAFGEAVAPVLLEFGVRPIGLGPARAERALVHLAAHAERAGLRKLRRAERTRVEAV